MENKPRLIFEEYPVDCNECARYWDSSCDGANENGRKCTSFTATRMLDIPNEINSLRNELRALQTHKNRIRLSIVLTDIAFLVHIVAGMVGGLSC